LADANELMMHVWNPRLKKTSSTCPPHPWLFDLKVAGPIIEKDALPVPSKDWNQVLPTYQAKALVAYLQSLHSDYSLPEAPLK
jgi:cbb3-type cytochrome oxidase cytochrome c subunit